MLTSWPDRGGPGAHRRRPQPVRQPAPRCGCRRWTTHPCEQQILRRLSGTETLRQIAADLYVPQNTVKTIISSLYRNLGFHSRSEAVSNAARAFSATSHDARHAGRVTSWLLGQSARDLI